MDMLFSVPQYIDVEDKVAGPLTVRQVLWMIGMGAVLLILWNMLEKAPFYAVAVPTVCVFMAFAFYRPYNQPLITFIGSAIFFVVRPKVYVWDRQAHVRAHRKEPKEFSKKTVEVKNVSAAEVRRLASIVDRNSK
jgi:hypothetical protein